MGDYENFSMNLPQSGETMTRICHARGENSNMPAQWLLYIRVKDVAESAARCNELGVLFWTDRVPWTQASFVSSGIRQALYWLWYPASCLVMGLFAIVAYIQKPATAERRRGCA